MKRAVLLALVLATSLLSDAACASWFRGPTLPATLNDADFWSLSTALSEPPGVFSHSDNFVSNEIAFAQISRLLRGTGGVYIGVGPEQNFSYLVRLRPQLAFIVDIRQENRSLHLLYKALFDISANRVQFVSRLFSRGQPAGLGTKSSARDIFAAFAAVPASAQLRDDTAQSVRKQLLEMHRLPLQAADLQWIDYALQAFYTDGPDIRYGRANKSDAAGPSYRALMTMTDLFGYGRSYLASEDGFAFVKELHARNLIVPVVGNFAGPKTLQAIGDYVRQHAGTVRAFYGSNVDVYLSRQEAFLFCKNLSFLPFQFGSWFIGNKTVQPVSSKLKSCSGTAPVPLNFPEVR
jgi:hypothetical protein